MRSWPSFKDILSAYRNCRLHKPANRSQTIFERRLGENLLKLHAEIHSGRYKPRPARVFVVTHPKPREIFAADFRDRVVHHLVASRIEPRWEKKFIYASFACRDGKGVHGAIKYLQNQVRRLSQGGLKSVWALQLDLASFFVTINRSLLVRLLTQHERDPKLIELIRSIYDHDARVGAKYVGDKKLLELIPSGKSWFSQGKEQGLPIGNLTSQLGANVYLNALDHFIVRTLKPQAYMRYMDDLTLLDHDKEKLAGFAVPIDEWLHTHRQQALNPTKTILTRLDQGIHYLGYRLKQTPSPKEPLQIFIDPKKKWKIVLSARAVERYVKNYYYRPHRHSHALIQKDWRSLLATLNSRIGALLHGNSFLFRKEVLQKVAKVNSFMLKIKKGYRSLRFK